MLPLPDLETLRVALTALPPRFSQLLNLRVLEAHAAEECARRYGVSREALAVHLLRSAEALACELGGMGRPTAVPWERERARALWLDAALGSPQPSSPPETDELARLAELLRYLRAQAAPLRASLRAAEEAAARSPRGRREERLRHAAIAVLVVMTLYFLLR